MPLLKGTPVIFSRVVTLLIPTIVWKNVSMQSIKVVGKIIKETNPQ
jgi:hypothetical protein